MARVKAIGEVQNASEREAIRHLRETLSDEYTILHNFEIERQNQHFEVDLAVIAPHAVYLVDVKGTRGLISVHGSEWHPAHGSSYPSPLLKLRSHARKLKGLITDSDPTNRTLRKIYVGATILLTHPKAKLNDPADKDAPDVTSLEDAGDFFRDESRIPPKFSADVQSHYKTVLTAIEGSARPSEQQKKYGTWEVTEELGSTDLYTEYRGYNTEAGPRAGEFRIRVYPTDPYSPEEEQEAEKNRIRNAFRALNGMPVHPSIISPRDFQYDGGSQSYVLVTEDVRGQSLRLSLSSDSLDIDTKSRVAKDVVDAIAHAHSHDVIHRNLSPSSILVTDDERAKLTGFEYARPDPDRSQTLAGEIVDLLDYRYQAPECYRDPGAATTASDVCSAGLVLYELFVGNRAFESTEEMVDAGSVFPESIFENVEFPNHVDEAELDEWIQRMCATDPEDRPSASAVQDALESIFAEEESEEYSGQEEDIDYEDLPSGYELRKNLVVRERLGKPGGFGVAYKVFDALADRNRVVKLVLDDRISVRQRLKQEYKVLLNLDDHPHIVKALYADELEDETPYMIFPYVEGYDVRQMIEGQRLSLHEAWTMGEQVADGITHLHDQGVYHCDIKPSNLIWTDEGARIIDFNVAVRAIDGLEHGGGSRKYLPPDLDRSTKPTDAVNADRDCYALGITLYEAITGEYPWEDASTPPLNREARDPRDIPNSTNLSAEAVDVLTKAIAPKRAHRYNSAEDFLEAMQSVETLRRRPPSSSTDLSFPSNGDEQFGNPFVSYLRTLYSQSQQSNAGTRGLDERGEKLYIKTLLDRELAPAVFDGEFQLVIITGNAGDGKTAFLQKMEKRAENLGAEVRENEAGNGAQFEIDGWTFRSNYDGSQDEGDTTNTAVLNDFFDPYSGSDNEGWPTQETRLIAINEGRLIDFLEEKKDRFEYLRRCVDRGLATGRPENGVAVVNLNLRSVTAAGPDTEDSIFKRLLDRFTKPEFWAACESCPLSDKCYAYHNAKTFADPKVGSTVANRLETLYRLTILRGKLHLTLRDVGSALAYMLTSDRDCEDIQALHQSGDREEYLDGYYFNSWMGGTEATGDRLLDLLREVDVGTASDPRGDRRYDFQSPSDDPSLFDVEDRSSYDRDLLHSAFEDIQGDKTGKLSRSTVQAHQQYVSMRRRLSYFERRDEDSPRMLPFRSAGRMLNLLQGDGNLTEAKKEIIRAINRGEGLVDPERLGDDLALRIREVKRGTIMSYRIFDDDQFTLTVGSGINPRFVEHEDESLRLRYEGDENEAELKIDLDVFEMLDRLNRGYEPSPEELQGYYVSLEVFKNVLSAAPYEEVLLTPSGYDFYRIKRQDDGLLEMKHVEELGE